MKAKTKSTLTACLALALVACAVLGTIAYMTATSSKTNAFTVGNFNYPTTDPDGSGDSGGSGKIDIDGYILEKEWDKATDHKLVPDNTLAKDPNIGIGEGSEDAYVYAFVKNPMVTTDTNDETARDGSVYFQLNSGWEFVSGQNFGYKELTVNGEKYYTGGLFRYIGTGAAGTPAVLSATDADAWTGTIFDKVTCGKNMNTADMAKALATTDSKEQTETKKTYDIVVSAYIHQAKDGNGAYTLKDTAEDAAKAWAPSQNQ